MNARTVEHELEKLKKKVHDLDDDLDTFNRVAEKCAVDSGVKIEYLEKKVHGLEETIEDLQEKVANIK